MLRCASFHASIGRAIGIKIEEGGAVATNRIATLTSIYLHDVSIDASEGIAPARAGFSDRLPIAGLPGMSGFFEY